jgi:hypothetical protein
MGEKRMRGQKGENGEEMAAEMDVEMEPTARWLLG